MSFLRLKTVEIGYTFPKKWMEKIYSKGHAYLSVVTTSYVSLLSNCGIRNLVLIMV